MSWPEKFMGLAHHVATWSKDPSTKVGCVAVGDSPNLVAHGYNGLPPGIRDDDRLQNRDWKYGHVIHAEMNALANCSFDPVILFVTHPCCHRCAVHILGRRTIKQVVYDDSDELLVERWADSIEKAKHVFAEAQVGFGPLTGPRFGKGWW